MKIKTKKTKLRAVDKGDIKGMKFWTNAKKYRTAAQQAVLNIGVSLEIRAFYPAQTS